MWAPLATGIAVVLSQSTTQVADFTRRTMEFAALLISWLVFRRVAVRGSVTGKARARLERAANLSVAAALFCSSLVVAGLALSRLETFQPGGNVYPGMIIATLGLITNSWFWRRYRRLNREQHNAIIDTQRRLYRAKAFVDLCVIAALAAVAVDPTHVATRYVDLLGSFAVTLYLMWSAWQTTRTAAAPGVEPTA